jgi:two-component system response regulator AtoC
MDGDEYDSTVLVSKGSARDRLRAIVVMDGIALTYGLPQAGDVRIGRFTGSNLVVNHDTLSRFHAVLHFGPPMTIEDLGSANGTFVRENRIKPGQHVPVSVGDVLRLGDVIVILQRVDASA